MNILEKTYKHFITITTHKLLVTKLCFRLGLYKQGLLHDISKYTLQWDRQSNMQEKEA